MENQTFGNYTLRNRIGAGSFGQIYTCFESESNKLFAVKVEEVSARIPQLQFESKLYKLLSNSQNVAKMYYYHQYPKQRILVIDLLGKSLESHLETCKALSMKTVLMLFDQMLSSIEYMHRKHFIHRDIKPDNFVLGTEKNASKVYLIDFGLAKRYRDPKTLKHNSMTSGKALTGTARYASINALKGFEQSRRDDLESLGYVIIYLLAGRLPWMGISGKSAQNKYDMICECKIQTSIESLCSDFPSLFLEYFKSVKSLRFDEEPPYSTYRKNIRELLVSMGFCYDGMFDWTIQQMMRKRKTSLPPIPVKPMNGGKMQDCKCPSPIADQQRKLAKRNHAHAVQAQIIQANQNMQTNQVIQTNQVMQSPVSFVKSLSGSGMSANQQNSVKVNAQVSTCDNIGSDSFTQQCADLKQLLDLSSSCSEMGNDNGNVFDGLENDNNGNDDDDDDDAINDIFKEIDKINVNICINNSNANMNINENMNMDVMDDGDNNSNNNNNSSSRNNNSICNSNSNNNHLNYSNNNENNHNLLTNDNSNNNHLNNLNNNDNSISDDNNNYNNNNSSINDNINMNNNSNTSNEINFNINQNINNGVTVKHGSVKDIKIVKVIDDRVGSGIPGDYDDENYDDYDDDDMLSNPNTACENNSVDSSTVVTESDTTSSSCGGRFSVCSSTASSDFPSILKSLNKLNEVYQPHSTATNLFSTQPTKATVNIFARKPPIASPTNTDRFKENDTVNDAGLTSAAAEVANLPSPRSGVHTSACSSLTFDNVEDGDDDSSFLDFLNEPDDENDVSKDDVNKNDLNFNVIVDGAKLGSEGDIERMLESEKKPAVPA